MKNYIVTNNDIKICKFYLTMSTASILECSFVVLCDVIISILMNIY